ncbi:N-acetylated-alpha-linked acidic dipeptidase 2 [Parasteatoda tepidariorum]|uniref:N-acetylated-alpha-linked acidic dipeptidase 2 n=1 Tax=Parasteatoda tepidariorum TaxID=114398 RepID=UPI00077FAE66|nr:N-acetylated-alpha-linked acidic dipeptidase 2 [Parasteatoda tepidariorum]
MKMTAQYRPYRNEDGMEAEQVTWGDQEVGDVEIYQRTTEEIRVSNRNLVVAGIGIGLISALLGLIIGYFAHSEHSQCIPSLSVALHSVQEANPYVRRKISQMISSEEIKNFIKDYSREPHIAGSSTDRHFALNIKSDWLKHSMDSADIVEYNVLLSYPDKEKPNVVKIIDNLNRDVVKIESHGKKTLNPAFSAYSLPGNATGNLVYINYGQTSDFTYLKSLGIPIEGKILIARHWKLPADEIVWNAQQFKAAGLILYPDPDKYNPPILHSDSYPKTWWLPSNAARTDSILWNGAGDPLTPGYPARHDANRLSISSALLPALIVQPISYDNAYILLSSLAGPDAPKEWQGGFNFTYKLGGSFKDSAWKIQLQVYNQYVNKTIYNVIGTIRGKTEPDRYVIIGGHRDAWSYGAVDAAGGTAALLELSRVYGRLLKEGWRPRRTIMFCSWGAEEHNLIGSTEWLEDNLKLLHGRAVAYINADILVAGNASLRAVASPLLYNAIFNATKEVLNPNELDRAEGMKTVYDAWLMSFPHKRNRSDLLYPNYARPIMHLPSDSLEDIISKTKVDSNSSLLDSYLKDSMQLVRPKIREMDMRGNYAPFFVHAGIPALDVSFVHDSTMSSSSYPLHHTEYDNFEFVKNLIDPSFKYHATVTKILGELLRDLADSLFLPFNLFDYAQILQDFFLNLNSRMRRGMEEHAINLNHLESAIKNFSSAALKFHSMQETVDLSDPMTVRRINDQLLLLERAFLDQNGLPRNIYKKHIIMSPSESYLSGIFPGLLDEFSNLEQYPQDSESSELIKAHFSVLVFTIQSAAKIIESV